MVVSVSSIVLFFLSLSSSSSVLLRMTLVSQMCSVRERLNCTSVVVCLLPYSAVVICRWRELTSDAKIFLLISTRLSDTFESNWRSSISYMHFYQSSIGWFVETLNCCCSIILQLIQTKIQRLIFIKGEESVAVNAICGVFFVENAVCRRYKSILSNRTKSVSV